MKKETTPTDVLYLALELSDKNWKLGFSINHQTLYMVDIRARNVHRIFQELEGALKRFKLTRESTTIHSVYEAGRDGFWLDRLLREAGIKNLVIDPGSIEKKRRKTAKTDRLDVKMLTNRLIRWLDGDGEVWSVVRVPSAKDEAQRIQSREWSHLRHKRTSIISRVRGILNLFGIEVKGPVGSSLKELLGELRGPCDIELPLSFQAQLSRDLDRLALLEEQLKELARTRKKRLAQPKTRTEQIAAKLYKLRSLGPVSSECLAQEFYFRDFKNRREVGGASGLTGTPFSSGSTHRDNGISKTGNKRVRTAAIELGWCWLRYQPDSELSKWYEKRYGSATSRQRKIGIAALARKLLVALWKYVKTGERPPGAILKPEKVRP